MTRVLRAFAPALAWAVVVWLIGGSESVAQSAPRVPGLDKLGHFGMYGVLGFLLGRGWRDLRLRTSPVWSLLLVVALGCADELRQARLAARSAEVADWVADVTGGAAGLFLALHLARGRRDNDDGRE